jgi:hypothetical protein
MKKHESNPFTLSFGNKPYEYVSREKDKEEIIEKNNKRTTDITLLYNHRCKRFW